MDNNELLQAIYNDLQEVKKKVTKLEVTIENETNKNIKLLAEGHGDVVNRLEIIETKVENVQDTVSVLKIITNSFQSK